MSRVVRRWLMPLPMRGARRHPLLSRKLIGCWRRRILIAKMLLCPSSVRAISGAVVDSGDALVLDLPWYAQVLDADRLVVGDIAEAGRLASVVGSAVGVRGGCRRECSARAVEHPGRGAVRGADRYVRRFAFGWWGSGCARPLEVCLSGAVEATVQVPWWVDGKTTHFGSSYRNSSALTWVRRGS